jgi:hypothetical protein
LAAPRPTNPNGTWGCVDDYPPVLARDNIPKVSLLLLAEDIKERSGSLHPLIPQFTGQCMRDLLEVSRLHVEGGGKVSTNCRGRELST